MEKYRKLIWLRKKYNGHEDSWRLNDLGLNISVPVQEYRHVDLNASHTLVLICHRNKKVRNSAVISDFLVGYMENGKKINMAFLLL